MPAKSKQQQKFFGVVKSMQKGDIPKKGEAGEVADDMTKKEVDKMESTKHKGLPKKIKEMVEEELQALNEVQPFVDNKLRNQWEYPLGNRDGLVYLATNDKRYPTEIVIYNQKRDVLHFVYSHDGRFNQGNTKTQTVPMKGFNSTHWVMPYFEDWQEDFDYERGFKENKVTEDNKDDIRFDLVMSDEAYDELFDLISRYVKDPDDVEKELDSYDDGGFDSMSNMVTANLDRDKDYIAWKKKYGIKESKITEAKDPIEKDLSIINKARAKAALKQIKSGKRDDGMGKFTARLFGVTPSGEVQQITDPRDLNMYKKFGLAEAKMTPAKVQKAQRELVATIQLLKKNFPMYKAAKESGNEKKLEKHRDIAVKLTKKKKQLEIALDKALGGLYQDAELDLKEAAPRMRIDPDSEQLMSILKDVSRIENKMKSRDRSRYSHVKRDFKKFFDSLMNLKSRLDRQGPTIPEGKLNEEDYKYKKQVSKAFDKINDAMFNFRHAMGLKQLTNKDMKLKKQVDSIHQAIFDLQKQLKSQGLTEALARGLKPLLMLGSKVKWTTMSEDALLDLSDKFEDIDDEQAEDIASHLNMAIELRQDGYKGDSTKKLKQFNKACADALKGKQVKSAFESVNEALPKFKTPFEAYDWIMGKRTEAMDIEMDMLQKTKDIIQTQKDMEQEAEPGGGPIADKYGKELDKLQMEHEALRNQFAAIMAEIDEYDQNY